MESVKIMRVHVARTLLHEKEHMDSFSVRKLGLAKSLFGGCLTLPNSLKVRWRGKVVLQLFIIRSGSAKSRRKDMRFT